MIYVKRTVRFPPVAPHTPRRRANYEAVQSLRRQGITLRTIAQELGLAINTVLKYAHLPAPPVPQPHADRLMLPYETFVQQHWQVDIHHVRQLFNELQKQGFSGSYQTVARHVAVPRAPRSTERQRRAPITSARQLTVSAAVRLLLLPPQALSDEERDDLAHLCRVSEPIAQTYPLAQQFQEMVRKRQPERLADWVKQAQASQATSLRSFAAGLLRDWDAVVAALSLPFSNGPTEGHINRLKQIKRHMYGRGKLDLLKQRVLYRGTIPSPALPGKGSALASNARTGQSNRPLHTQPEPFCHSFLPERSAFSAN